MARWLTLCLLALLLAGCGSTPRRESVPEAARVAEALYRDGEFAQAAAAFLAAADEQRSRRDFYHLRAAESWRELADLDAAERALEGIGRRRLDEEESLRLDLLLAELALRRQEMQAAQQLLVRPSDTVPERFRARYHDLAARAWAPDDPFLAASEHALLHDYLRPAEQPGNLQRIEALLVRVPNAELATRTAALPPGHPLYRHAGHALSVRGMPLPRIDDRSIGWQQDGSAPAADVDGYRPPRRVALLLPAQGPMAAAGRAVREGFLAAYYEEQRERPEVLMFDTGSSVDDALAAYRRAVDAGVDAVVGPLSRDSVAALFDRGVVTVPVLALNRSTGAPPPPGSLSFALAPEEEAIAIAERLAHNGARRVVGIATAGDNGSRSLAAFRARFEALGGVVAAETLLANGDPNFADALRATFDAAGRAPAPSIDAAPVATAAGADAAPAAAAGDAPRYAVDALFLAVDPEQARLLVPQLKLIGAADIPMSATSQIHAVAGNVQLDRELDGIVTSEVPWLLVDQPGIPDYDHVAAELPFAVGPASRLLAFGIDAFRLLAYLEFLAQDPYAQLQGATGVLRIDGFGRVLRTPGWGVFQDGELQPLRAPARVDGAY